MILQALSFSQTMILKQKGRHEHKQNDCPIFCSMKLSNSPWKDKEKSRSWKEKIEFKMAVVRTFLPVQQQESQVCLSWGMGMFTFNSFETSDRYCARNNLLAQLLFLWVDVWPRPRAKCVYSPNIISSHFFPKGEEVYSEKNN